MSDSSASGLNGLCGSLLGLTVVFVGLRFLARVKYSNPLKADDFLMLLSLICFIGIVTCVFIGIHIRRYGYSTSELTDAYLATTAKENSQLGVSIDILSFVCLWGTKSSALFFYRRIFSVLGPGNRIFNAVCLVSFVVVSCWLVTFIFLAIFQCHTHFDAMWDGNYNKYCTISYPFLYGLSVSDVILDVWILGLPIPMLLRLHATWTRRLGVSLIFLVAFAALGASLARMVIFIHIFDLGIIGAEDTDPERVLTRLIFFYVLEAGVSILAINIPSIWPIFFKVCPETFLRAARSMTSLMSGKLQSFSNSDASTNTSPSRRPFKASHCALDKSSGSRNACKTNLMHYIDTMETYELPETNSVHKTDESVSRVHGKDQV